jgi:type I restriction enzyme M protein
MEQRANDMISEFVKLNEASQKIISEIKKQNYDDSVCLHLFLSILLLRDGFLGQFRKQMNKSLEFDISIIPDQYDNKRRQIYNKIFEKLNTIFAIVRFGNNQHVINLCYENLHHIKVSEISDEDFILTFEALLSQLYEIGKREHGVSLLPKDLIDLIYILDSRKNKVVLNPFSGFGDLSFSDTIAKYNGQESNPYLYVLHSLRVLVHKHEDKITISDDNSLLISGSKNIKYDLVISMPPIGKIPNYTFWDMIVYNDINDNLIKRTEKTYENSFFTKAIKSLNEDGKVIGIVSQGFFTSQPKSRNLRKEWVDNTLIETVLALPKFNNPGFSKIQYYIIVLNTGKSNQQDVKFIDARQFYTGERSNQKSLGINKIKDLVSSGTIDGDLVKNISFDLIKANDYDLFVGRYFEKNYEGTKLGEFCSEIDNLPIAVAGKVGLGVKISNLKNERFNSIIRAAELKYIEVEGYKEISESCLLIALIGGKLKPTFFKYYGQEIYIHPNLIPLKVDESKVNINYLISELHKEYVLEQVKNIQSGTVIEFISKSRLKELKVDISISPDSQKIVIEKIIDSVDPDVNIEEKFKQFRRELFEDLQQKEHDITHFIWPANMALLSLQILLEKEGVVESKYVSEVNDLLKRISTNLELADSNIKTISKEIDDDIKEVVDINTLLEEAKMLGISDSSLYRVEYIYNKESFCLPISDLNQDNIYVDPKSYISKNHFFKLYSNLLSNAINHGFKPREKVYTFRVELLFTKDKSISNCLTIVFSNNGSPMPPGMADKYCIRGAKAGESANKGLGSYQVCKIVRSYFGGELNIFDEPNNEFPVKIEIKIPLHGWEDFKF